VLQDKVGGVPECSLLVSEFDKCKAGGLPPPVRLPSEADVQAEAEAARKAQVEAEDPRGRPHPLILLFSGLPGVRLGGAWPGFPGTSAGRRARGIGGGSHERRV
jgi:hypothetical protein